MASDYSKTPLTKKLGYKKGFKLLFYNQPDYYFGMLDGLPDDLEELEEIVPESADFIHLFVTSFSELEKIVPQYKSALKKTGMFWVSYPKGGSSIPTDINQHHVRNFTLTTGLVDSKVASINQDWSSIRFGYRLKDR
ncbi:DUF3052 domain-containing protein [Flammeovirgaceae bacterium SG7u.111]|nr:DUF3052 domain-containing protein [Flammeovirgaceae bacterium SG7u.132]WPO37023.1 DUF3052 domain-containing protein [Flammeovirgaceae bacterium SG7u.111]